MSMALATKLVYKIPDECLNPLKKSNRKGFLVQKELFIPIESDGVRNFIEVNSQKLILKEGRWVNE